MTLGARISAAREARGWNQSDLAEKIGVEPATVSRWENDEMAPRPRRLKAISEAVGKSIEWLRGVATHATDIEQRLLALELDALKSNPLGVNHAADGLSAVCQAWLSAGNEPWRRQVALFFLTGDPGCLDHDVPEELARRLSTGLNFFGMTPKNSRKLGKP